MIENIIIYMDQYLDQNLFKIINFRSFSILSNFEYNLLENLLIIK